MEKMVHVNKPKMTMGTFVIAILAGVEIYVMKILTNVPMDHTTAIMVDNASMKKEWLL